MPDSDRHSHALVAPAAPGSTQCGNLAVDGIDALAIAETVRHPLLVLDASLLVRFANAAFYRAFALSPWETLGRSIYSLADGQWNHSELRRLLEDVLPRRTRVDDFELVSHFGPGGRRVLWLNASEIVVAGAERRSILLAMDDVTERIRAEQAAAERTGELERFTMVASHDLQEPLRKIRTFGALLADECAAGLDETGRDYVTRMSAAAERMQTLIDDLLTLARATTRASRMTRLDLGTVVQDVLIDLEVGMRESGAVVNVSELPTVDADPVEMRQLFLNLISNALKFRRDDVAPVVTITSRNLEGVLPTIEIAVQDNGIGFDPRHAELVFQPFQRLHGRHEFAGNGIGLALCRRIVERHGGSIHARSVAGESTTFLFTIPIGEARRILPALPTTQRQP